MKCLKSFYLTFCHFLYLRSEYNQQFVLRHSQSLLKHNEKQVSYPQKATIKTTALCIMVLNIRHEEKI